MKKIYLLALIFLVITLTFEITSFFLTKYNLFIVNDTPLIYKSNNLYQDNDLYRNEMEPWGAWRAINSTMRVKGSCYDYLDKSNEIGARDTSFRDVAQNSWILLGDSFAEGYGVSDINRAQAHIEKYANKKILNFGTAMHFGPVQYWRIYHELARKYPHEGIIIFLLPMNDFTDNDYSYWKETGLTFIANGAERYRPYFKKNENDDYDFFIPPAAIKRDSILYGVRSPFMQWMSNYFWTSNAYRTFQIISLKKSLEINNQKISSKNLYPPKPYSGYFDATLDQQKGTMFFLEKIIKEAGSKKITIVSIPTSEDFLRFKKGENREKMFWWVSLKSLQHKYIGRVEFIDLVDNLPSGDYKKLTLPCDGHWGPEGNKWAGELIGRKMSNFK